MVTHRYDSAATRDDLIAAARKLFGAQGYAASGTEDIAAATGLTRGAMYHQFGNKQGLFQAVLEQVQTELTAEVNRQAVAAKGTSLDGLRAGFHAYLDFALQDDVRQILLIDGPAVLGWEAWQAIDHQHAFSATCYVLKQAMTDGEIANAPVEELTHVLLGAVTQAGLEIGRSDSPAATRRRYRKVVDLLIDGLRTAT